MKRTERLSAFRAFYQKNYEIAMNYFLSKTGDFLNIEDLLEKSFRAVYRHYIKTKVIEEEQVQRYFYASLKKQLSSYNGKKRKTSKPSAYINDVSFSKLLEKEFNLTDEVADRRMILHDILAFISQKPKIERRVFVYYIYFDKSIDKIAQELNLNSLEVERILVSLLAEIEKTFLEDF